MKVTLLFESFEYLLTLSSGGLTLPAYDLTKYVCTSFAMLELCDNMIHKTELHERDAAENMLKFNNLPQPFLCESHSQAIKLINRIISNVYFNNAKKHVNNQVRQDVLVKQLKQKRRKRRRT